MDVVVVRHGIAIEREDAAENAISDAERPLTAKGRRRMKKAAKGLSRLSKGAELVLSSPLLRAIETAKIVRRAFDDDIGYGETDALLPDAEPAELVRALTQGPPIPAALVVGHEPHLGLWVGWCLAGQATALVELGKGGACLIRFDEGPAAGKGQLIWLMTAPQLGRVG